MKTRTVLILLGTLLLLVVVALLAGRSETARRQAQLGGGKLLAGFTAAKAVKLEVVAGGQTSTLVKADGTWTVGAGGPAADPDAVTKALAELERLDRRQLISENPAKQEAMQVDEGNPDAVTVRVWTAADADPAVDLLIGKTGNDYQSNYVRRVGDDQVYLSPELIRTDFDRGKRGWRDLHIFRFDPEKVASIELRSPDADILLERAAGPPPSWRIATPQELAADPDAADAVASTLADLSGDEIAEPTDPGATGLDPPERTSRVVLEDGRELVASWGKESGGKVFVRKSGDDTVYALYAWRQSSVFKGLGDLEAKPPPSDAGTDTGEGAASSDAATGAAPTPGDSGETP